MFERKSMEELILEGELTLEGQSIALGADMAFGNTGSTDRISGIGEDSFENPFVCRAHVPIDADGGTYVTPFDANLLPEDD